MPSPDGVAERAVFWAELGAVAAPVLLGRLGRAVEDAADSDPELRAALWLAASHVREKCLVWPVEGTSGTVRQSGMPCTSGLLESSACDKLSADERCRAERSEVIDRLSRRRTNDNFWHRDAALSMARTWGGSDVSSSDTESLVSSASGLRGLMRLAPRCCPSVCLRLLPGVGDFAVHVVWVVLLCLAAPIVLIESYMKGFNNPFHASDLSTNVGPMIDNILALKFVLYLPLVVSCRALVMDDHFGELLCTELSLPEGQKLKTFVYRSAVAIIVEMLLRSAVEYRRHDQPFGNDLYSNLCIVRGVLCFMSEIMFLIVYKLSVNMVDRLRDHISDPEMTARFWNDATRKYLATCRSIDLLWRKMGFSTAVSLVFAFNMLFAAVFVAIGLADLASAGFVTTWRPWVWAMKQVVIVLVGLYFIASINSRSSSSRHAKASLVHLARQQCGVMPSECLQEHWTFIATVEGVPCGVEVAILPVLTMAFVAPVVRIAFVVAPIVGGMAYSLAQRNEQPML